MERLQTKISAEWQILGLGRYSLRDLAWVIWNYHGNKKTENDYDETKSCSDTNCCCCKWWSPGAADADPQRFILSLVSLGKPEPVFSCTTQRNHSHKMTTLYNRRRPRQSTDMSRLIDRMWPLLPATSLFLRVTLSDAYSRALSLSPGYCSADGESGTRGKRKLKRNYTRTHTHADHRGHKAGQLQQSGTTGTWTEFARR